MDLVPVVSEFVVFVSINTLALKIIRSMYLLSFNPALYFFFYSRITGTGGPCLVQFFGLGKNRTLRNSYVGTT